jgi:hypothetical protein
MNFVRTPRTLWLVVVALVAAGCTSGAVSTTTSSTPTTSTTLPTTSTTLPPIAAVDVAVTPSGWVPVDYGDAQVSVPASFTIFYPGWSLCGTPAPNAIYVGPPGRSAVGCGVEAASPRATTIWIEQGHSALKPSAAQTIINGLHLHALIARFSRKIRGYESPALGSEIIGGGPLANRIFRTLTRSPRTVALTPGSAPPVPRSWKSVTFDGLRFDVPRSWLVAQTAETFEDVGRSCAMPGVSFTNTEVVLSTDERAFPVGVGCPNYFQMPQQPNDGVEVDGGSDIQFPFRLLFSNHCLDLHGLTACPATTPAYSILFLRVTAAGHKTPVLVSIGLAGNGMVARTILYSLRAS